MTLAALSPLYTWWLLFFTLLAAVRWISLGVARRQEMAWPPPVVLQLATPVYANWPPPAVTT